ncbi:uncharacterized protein LOC128549326 [Mercenaria mercenaria]|uniref:uncharacterized protein LOC128549326 n=1 Tax=Mercenaria mercenaria TaxID=6596 RepID=UPI00234E680B|nr:uncharacterized protein LOC128549326 [Mercenaria mercenaria]
MGQQDPCYFHQEINDTTMTLGFVLAPSDSVVCDTISPGWTRFSGSDEGLMATECPLGRECGTDQQVWMQDESSEMLITVSTSSSTSTTSSTPTIPSSTSIKTTSQPTSVLSTSIKTTTSTATRVPTTYRTSTLKSSGKGCISGSAVAGMFSVTSALIVTIFK